MRWGVRDENSDDHKTWIECSNAIKWCKEQSMGLCFLSLQADKYGYTPLPKAICQEDLEAHLKITQCPESTRSAIFNWYRLDENAKPPEYMLSCLTDENKVEYWKDYGPMLKVLTGVAIDTKDFHGLLVGQSVTEYEFRAALSPTPVSRHVLTSLLWSHRHFAGEVNDEDYNDTENSPVKAQYLKELKGFMAQQLPSSIMQTYDKDLTLSDLKAATGELSGKKKEEYMASFKAFTKNRLFDSLYLIIDLQKAWVADGCGVGIKGSQLTEMLHHTEYVLRSN
jgi:hypothetical protein